MPPRKSKSRISINFRCRDAAITSGNFQNTIASPITLSGVGIHTGKPSSVTVSPAEANTGRIFVLNGHRVPATAEFVIDSNRCTTLGTTEHRVSTVEHLLAALAGLHIDNALITVTGPEIPI